MEAVINSIRFGGESMKNERYYYNIMFSEEKIVYKLIYNALKMRAYNIAVPNTITADRVQDIY